MKYQNWIETQASAQYPVQNKFLAVAVKTHANADIKVFWPCPIFLDLFTFGKIFCY